MYTISKNTQIILSLLKAHGIRHIVISPGATNIPITQGVQNDPFFTCYSVVDERSAMYFAIGLYLELGVPIATSCTAAQATRNYIPGLTEAFYKHVPILAITASKHPKHTYQEYMQGPDQTSLPADAVKKTFALPYVDGKIDELHCTRMVNEAILELTHRTSGPVQLNMPENDSELGIYNVPTLPTVRVIKRYMEWDKWDTPLNSKKIMIVVGEHRPFTAGQTAAIEAFCKSHNAFVYVNHLSNYHGEYTVLANLALAGMGNEAFKTYKPDILITIGGQTGDYPLYGKLAMGDWHDFEHWRIAEDGNVVDTYDKLSKIFECPFELFFYRLSKNTEMEHSYLEQWKELELSTSIPDNLPFSNAYLAQQLHCDIPKNSYLNLAILNSLRHWSFFPLDPSITCYSNVAAFGIDGCMSVFLGESVATDNLCFLVIGDLAFFYDMNSLGIRQLKNNVRILLVNNGCGIEFKNYNHVNYQFGKDGDAYVAAVGHNGNSAKGWVENVGFKYLQAKNKDEFLKHKDEFLGKSEESIVFEIFTTPEDESDALKSIIENNRMTSGMDVVKDKVRSLVGAKGVSILKNMIKK
ncbi:MAG: 2-succinyl-5-enolpyruvyl-6-hydroxy-3-cyclohexene-1-carboxylate synthase [Prevotella sp.]|jgi:2-succinyl-5-enolpyruvyl-6-hydroxy-3-cyclohexene-1-carboxylate synthase|nr:2-succinyl-5-enolpyruvyl-6-hydroxy-3-cyclohexene-1-carboxylate synthase [Prevotella sp.]